MCEDLFVCASQVYYFLFPFLFYCKRSNANFNSAISYSRMIFHFPLLYILTIFHRLVFLRLICPFYPYKDCDMNQRTSMLPFSFYLYINKFWLLCHNLLLHVLYSPYTTTTSTCPQFCGHFIDIIIVTSFHTNVL